MGVLHYLPFSLEVCNCISPIPVKSDELVDSLFLFEFQISFDSCCH